MHPPLADFRVRPTAFMPRTPRALPPPATPYNRARTNNQ